MDYAVKKARQAFDAGVWSRIHPTERKEIMIKWVKRLKRERYELTVLESLDSGKPVRDIAEIDLAETIHCLAWYAEAADKLFDKMAPSADDAMALIVREPVGVVGCILPWNFPMLMLAWKVANAPTLSKACIRSDSSMYSGGEIQKSTKSIVGKEDVSRTRLSDPG